MKIHSLEALKDVIYYRNKLLTGSYNKDDYKQGYKMLNDEQLEAFNIIKQMKSRSRLITNSGIGVIAKQNRERRLKLG